MSKVLSTADYTFRLHACFLFVWWWCQSTTKRFLFLCFFCKNRFKGPFVRMVSGFSLFLSFNPFCTSSSFVCERKWCLGFLCSQDSIHFVFTVCMWEWCLGFFSVVELQSIFEFMFYVWEWCLGLLGSSFNPFCVELFGFSSFYTFNPFCVILSVGEWCLVFIFVLDLQSILCSSDVWENGDWFFHLFLSFNPFCVWEWCLDLFFQFLSFNPLCVSSFIFENGVWVSFVLEVQSSSIHLLCVCLSQAQTMMFLCSFCNNKFKLTLVNQKPFCKNSFQFSLFLSFDPFVFTFLMCNWIKHNQFYFFVVARTGLMS
jgi:hypothetical protein